ncbi:Protein FRA10AC1 homolog [Eumeta japonica]|uniref:Protein FRA10AC1 homolog n=1 Tax=Eumeta variegata TaxID=151549 RepID=A0A4C1ZE35_EUMVA|nr:Protein FRA10AC1 homolog [Eumeta japonica]
MSARLRNLNAYELHKYLVNIYCLNAKGATGFLKRDTSRDRTDLDVIRENHKFLWEDDEVADTWEKQLAKKYYDKLFKEYCICDLTRYKENKSRERGGIEIDSKIGIGIETVRESGIRTRSVIGIENKSRTVTETGSVSSNEIEIRLEIESQKEKSELSLGIKNENGIGLRIMNRSSIGTESETGCNLELQPRVESRTRIGLESEFIKLGIVNFDKLCRREQ